MTSCRTVMKFDECAIPAYFSPINSNKSPAIISRNVQNCSEQFCRFGENGVHFRTHFPEMARNLCWRTASFPRAHFRIPFPGNGLLSGKWAISGRCRTRSYYQQRITVTFESTALHRLKCDMLTTFSAVVACNGATQDSM